MGRMLPTLKGRVKRTQIELVIDFTFLTPTAADMVSKANCMEEGGWQVACHAGETAGGKIWL